MAVMVTGASGVVGRATVAALVGTDEVRATVRRPDDAESLRATGAKVTIREIDQVDTLAEVLRACHTLVHLVGGPQQPDDDEVIRANAGSVVTAIEAAREAGVRRFVLVSVPGATPEATDPFLRAKGLAEEAVASSGLEHAIVRSTHVYGLGGLWFTATVEGALADPPFVPGNGDQELAPVFVADLAGVIRAIDDAPGPIRGTWSIEGPDVLTADELTAFLRADHVAPVHGGDASETAHALGHLLGVTIGEVAAAYLGRPSRGDAPDAAAAFGVERTTLREGLRRTLADAGSKVTG